MPFSARRKRALFIGVSVMKKLFSVCLLIILIFQSVFFAFAKENISAVTYPTPTDEANLRYVLRLGSGYRASPTPPVISDDVLITVSAGRLYKINAETGEILDFAVLDGNSLFSVVSPALYDEKIFVQLDGGLIFAYSFSSLEKLWAYEAPNKGQALCPIVCENGMLYTGFWNGETENADFVALSTKDEKPLTSDEIKTAFWTYTSKGGFYKTECFVTEKSIILGKDNGSEDDTAPSNIISLDKMNGKLISSLETKGDIRTGISYCKQTDSYFTASKSGEIYKFKAASDGSLQSLGTFKGDGAFTAKPVAHGGCLFAAGADGSKGKFYVLDTLTLKTLYTSETAGYTQGDLLISDYYEESLGLTYIYMTYNSPPGGITVFCYDIKRNTAERIELFTPDEQYSQYCISPVVSDADGVLYYKNDSGCIFSLDSVSVSQESLSKFIKSIKKLIELLKIFIRIFSTGAFK